MYFDSKKDGIFSGHRHVSDKFFLMLLAVAALLQMPTLTAAPRRRMHELGKEQSIPSVGLRIRIPSGARRQMLPPLKVRATKKSDGSAMYGTMDLWKQSQAVAVWSGGGIAVELARVKHPPFAGRDGLTSVAWAKKFWRNYTEPPDEAEILRWGKAFFDIDADRMVGIETRGDFTWRHLEPPKHGAAVFFGSGENSGETYMFMIRIRWSGIGGGDRDWRRLAERCATSAKMIPVQKVDDSGSGVYAERLAQAQKSVAGMHGWYIRETPNYIFVSDQRSRSDMRRLQNDLELARDIFSRYFPPSRDRQCVGVVKLFAERSEYLRYVGKKLNWTAGVWRPAERELVVSPLGVQVNDRTARRYMREVALHEGFHQYIFYAAGEVDPQLWFNEGCAQFFENCSPRDGMIAAPERRNAAKLAEAAAECRDLKTFLRLNHAEFYAANNRTRNYALSYALCYYLLRGAPALGEEKFAAIPSRYIEELRRTRDPNRALGSAFAGVDIEELSAKLKKFWSDREQQRRAREYRDPRLK